MAVVTVAVVVVVVLMLGRRLALLCLRRAFHATLALCLADSKREEW